MNGGPDRGGEPCGCEPDFPIRVRLDLAYDGTRFHGWQIQPEHRTVQGVLRRELTRLLGYEATPVGAGRTDAGVHARGQVAHLGVRTIAECQRLQRALALAVPDDIQINAVHRVSPGFNARFSATARTYEYRIKMHKDVFDPFCWQIHWDLDRRAMDAGAGMVSGTHDFSSFCKTSSLKGEGNVCTVDLCRFQWDRREGIFLIRANRFLHHMVRTLVGTLVEIGRGERPVQDMQTILTACDRRAAGRMAPARGLFLAAVEYPGSLTEPVEGESP